MTGQVRPELARTVPARRLVLPDALMKKNQEDMVEMKLRQAMGKVPVSAWMHGGYLRTVPFATEVK